MTVERLYIFCEGQTEEGFVNEVLEPHFRALSVTVKALVLPNKKAATERRHKGGWVDYGKARRFIIAIIEKCHSDATWFTTMLDFYALPADFPGYGSAPANPASSRVAFLENAFANDIRTDTLWRFTPNLQLHEFEALLLTDIEAFKTFFPDADGKIAALRADIGDLSPEAVNESSETAPSKRIIRYIPEYEGAKVIAGTLIAAEIGVSKLRKCCPHFGAWLHELESRISS